MTTRRFSLLRMVFLSAQVLSCSGGIDESKTDADGLCGIAETAFAKQDLRESLRHWRNSFTCPIKR